MPKTLILLAMLTAAVQTDPIVGTWHITGDIVGNPLDEICTIKEEGTTLSGSCTSEGMDPIAITGEVKDGKFTFQHGGDYQGQPLTVIYYGTLGTTTAFKGAVDVQPFDVGGNFTATAVPAKK